MLFTTDSGCDMIKGAEWIFTQDRGVCHPVFLFFNFIHRFTIDDLKKWARKEGERGGRKPRRGAGYTQLYRRTG